MLALFSTIKPQCTRYSLFIARQVMFLQRIDFPQLTRRHVAKRRGLRGRKTRNGPFSSFPGPTSFFSYPPPISALDTQATIVYQLVVCVGSRRYGGRWARERPGRTCSQANQLAIYKHEQFLVYTDTTTLS